MPPRRQPRGRTCVPEARAGRRAAQLTLIRPFIPAAACPGTVQRYSYVPLSVAVTLSVADWPGLSCFVVRPLHEFASGLLRAEQRLKS